VTPLASALFVLSLLAGFASATEDERARVESWLQNGDFARADSLAAALLAAAPDSSDAWIDAQHLVVRTARRSGRLPLPALVQVVENLIAVQEAVLPPRDPRHGEAWHELGNTHVRRGRQSEAAPAFRRAYEIRREVLGDDATPTIRSALGLANALQWTGRRDEARALFVEQIERLEADSAGREDRLVFALNGFGFLLKRTDDRDAAIDAFRRAVQIASTSMPRRHLTRALVERNLGNILAAEAPELAVDHLQTAYSIRRELLPLDDVLVGSVALELAEVQGRLGRITESDAHYAIAIEILGPRTDRDASVRRAWVGRANIAIERSDFDRAAAAIDSAAQRGTDATTVLVLRANRANEMGDFDVAVALYDEALRRREAIDGRQSDGFARLLHNRAEVLAAQGRTGAALASRREAVAIQEAIFETDDPTLALGRLNLAVSLVDAGEPEASLAMLEAVTPVIEKRMADNLALRANLRLLTARARAETQGPMAAIGPSMQAVTLRREAFGDDHIEVAWALDEVAKHRLATDFHVADVAAETETTVELARKADRIARAFLRDALRTLPERQALGFVEASRTGWERLVDAARLRREPNHVLEAFDATVLGRALVLDALLDRRRTIDVSDTTVARARRELDQARRALVAAATRGDADAERWRRLQTRRDDAETRLAALSVDERIRREREDRGSEHVFDALGEGEALVSFLDLVDADHTVAFVVRGRSIELVDLGSTDALASHVATWLDAVRAPISRFDEDPSTLLEEARAAGRVLGSAVIDPIVDLLGDSRRVWWVPDGALHRVQPVALVDAEGRFLATSDRVFAHLGAERDLEASGDGRTTSRILAIGDPDFGPADAMSPPCPDLESLRFAPLPATRLEVEALPATTRVLGRDAREDTLESLVGTHDTLHLATHGFFLPAVCDPSTGSALRGLRGIGGVVRRSGRATARAPELGPLLRSGLVLAGANLRTATTDPSRDGLLLAEEIAGMEMRGVETVVLSACDTGVGRIVGGEGVLGLPRAFRQAGARQVVMSLWPVQDAATQRWMEAFYAARVEGADTARAAHEARHAMLADEPAAHPFFWAAFVTIGPTR